MGKTAENMNKKRLKSFEKLSENEQGILIALAVIFIPIRQGYFQELLKRSGCVPADAANAIGKPLREKLLDLDLIALTKIGWWYCQYDIADLLLQKAIDRPEFMQRLESLVNSHTSFMPDEFDYEKSIRMLRIYFYQKKEKEFLKERKRIWNSNLAHLTRFYQQIFETNFQFQYLEALPASMRLEMLMDYLLTQQLQIQDHKLLFQWLTSTFLTIKKPGKHVVDDYAAINLIRGDIEGLEEWLSKSDGSYKEALVGMLRFIQNRNDDSIQHFQQSLKLLRKETGKRNVGLGGYLGFFFNLALLRSQTNENLELLRKQLKSALNATGYDADFFALEIRLHQVLDIYQAKMQMDNPNNLALFKIDAVAPYSLLFQFLMLFWLNKTDKTVKKNADKIILLNEYTQAADANDYFWFAAVSSNLLERIGSAEPDTLEIAQKYHDSPFNGIIDLIPRVEQWKRALNALTSIAEQHKPGGEVPVHLNQRRMVWLIELDRQGYVELHPREQRLGKNGQWSIGRPVAVKRLRSEPDTFNYLTEQDRRICSQIEMDYEEDYYSYYRREIFVLRERAVVEAIDHPNVYWNSSSKLIAPVKISQSTLQLVVNECSNNLLIKIDPYPQPNQQYLFKKTAANDLLVYKVEPQQHDVAVILGPKGLEVPKQARQQVIDSISAIASMLTIQSDIGGQSANAEMVEVDSRLHVHLQPTGEGIQIDIFVQPFADGGPIYKPGKGGSTVLAEIDGKQLQTTRNLELENSYLDQVLESSMLLYDTTDAKWIFSDTEMALEALLQLQALGDFAVLKWPQGKAIKISREAGLSQAIFSVRKKNDWFSLSGEIQVDDDRIIEIQHLMTLLSASPGRFLKLEDGQIISLTNELRQRLDDLSALGGRNGNNLDFHPLASWALRDLTEGMAIKASKPWRDQLTKLSEIDDLEPKLPTTLQGELREYQLQGFQWLTRLAYLGAGACLADDMGLGKTIQSLALILSRAMDGPTLILAPTSVCNNWIEESQRFAPTLNVHYFGIGDRQKMLDNAGPFDIIVCSYGLLQTETERVTLKHWHTIIADEAQAIKNPLTQRSKAAMALKGNFKMITTGTPIENHLGELWNLFHFINPGLLGTLKDFNERYALDIENKRNPVTQRNLKKLLQPFILRRLKNDVLTELPARTEVTLHVELSEEERHFYEALRRNAMQSIEAAQRQEISGGQQQIKVLAEITRLRRACCHPRLISPEIHISSAKLQAFEELIDELIANHHKALVFSQFVAHLALLRELLDNKGIRYQYLDGATSLPNRKKAVNAFQAGEGDLFLISLKAGGAGLNLTAADYVVHMDPWWNPAVEDQASDRAHRMGQKRPVTIYRLVAKDTIEDKIVALHQHKRDLADSLLAEGAVSGKMSLKDMLELIQSQT